MFVKALMVDFSQIENMWENNFDEIFVKLEEKISEQFSDIECDFLGNSLVLHRNNYINQDNIAFSHYLEEGKMLKNFLIENNLANENNYKAFFSLQKRELDDYFWNESWQEEKILLPSELDALIAPVDKNDPKILDVLNKIKNIKK